MNRGREERRSNARAARAAGHRAKSPAEHPAKPGRAPATGPLGRFHGLAHPSLWSAALALVLYLPALGDGFVWDDHWLIEANPALRGGGGLLRALVSDFWAPTGSASGYWRPLVVLSYGLDGALSHWSAVSRDLSSPAACMLGFLTSLRPSAPRGWTRTVRR